MSDTLDLDDVAQGHPVAEQELRELRAENAELTNELRRKEETAIRHLAKLMDLRINNDHSI